MTENKPRTIRRLVSLISGDALTAIVKFLQQARHIHAVDFALRVCNNGRRCLFPNFKEVFNVWLMTLELFLKLPVLYEIINMQENTNYVNMYENAMQQMSVNHIMDECLSKPVEKSETMHPSS
jgi:hypothetical protein